MRSSHITCTCFSPELFLSTLVSQVWFTFPVNQHWRGKWGKYQQSFPSILFKLVHVLVDVGHLSAGPYAFIKPITNKWVWGRCPSKLREPQASIKVTMTTCEWHHQVPSCWEPRWKVFKYLPRPTQGEGRAGSQKALAQAQAKTTCTKWTWSLKERFKNTVALKKP